MSDLVLDLAGDAEALHRRLSGELPEDAALLRLSELKRLGGASAVRHIRRARHATCYALITEFRRPGRWLELLLLTLASRARERVLVNRHGDRRELTWGSFFRHELPFVLRRRRTTRRVAGEARRKTARLAVAGPRSAVEPRDVLFVRADLGTELTGGGSLAHIHGVLSGLVRRGCRVRMLTPSAVAGLPGGVMTEVVPPETRYDLSVELPHLAYNTTLAARGSAILDRERPDLIYHRHALGCYAVAGLAHARSVPLVVEYNGPEVWIAEHWGAARRHMDLFREIEERSLRAADLVVAVSRALLEPLAAAGVAEERILVNPNGVDAGRFEPQRLEAGRPTVRKRLGVADEAMLVGFVGTFGPWHGAEVLAEAICRVPRQTYDLRFVFVGDGPGRARVQEILRTGGRLNRVCFTGAVAFDEIPEMLHACDICASPHVPNPDGSSFFGSPTKLFEYMAAGRAIVASELGQIGEVLEHGRNGWLVPPGNPDELARALVHLAYEPSLCHTLGRAARGDALNEHSWSAHVGRILARLARGGERSEATA